MKVIVIAECDRVVPLVTNNFFVGFEYPRTKSNQARIYLNGEHFANTWQVGPDWGVNANRWACNRDGKALELKLPAMNPTVTLEALLNELQAWYDRL